MSRAGRTRRRLRRMCFDKVQYNDEALARGVAAKARVKRGVRLRAYECPVCFSWHLTSKVH